MVAVVIYIVAHRQTVFAYARKRAAMLMLSAENGAEDLLLNSGSQKMDWVVQRAYQRMPAAVRLFVGIDEFRKIAQGINDEAKLLLEQHKTAVPVTAQGGVQNVQGN
jgi:hypothetical protein